MMRAFYWPRPTYSVKEVDSDKAKNAAEEIAKGIDGVKSVSQESVA